MLLENLHIGAKFEVTVFRVVELEASNDAAWTHGIRDDISGWEPVEPKDTGIYHFDYDVMRNLCEW
jgi:hypothetical protein